MVCFLTLVIWTGNLQHIFNAKSLSHIWKFSSNMDFLQQEENFNFIHLVHNPGKVKKSHNNLLIYIIFQIYFAEHQSKNLFPLESSNWILQKRSLSFMNYFFGISFPESISGSTSQWIIRFMTIQYFSGIQ